jgi:hypothetical protein
MSAREVSYDETREWQVVCAACREPIHKRGSSITQRQYFAHYRAKPDSECELRVRTMAVEVLRPQIVFPRGQQLERFLRRFEDIVIERHAGLKEVVHPLTQEMRRRPLYRRMVRINRTRLKEGLEVGLAGMPATLGNGTIACVREVCWYLLGPNSMGALSFALAYGVALHCLAADASSRARNSVDGCGLPDSPWYFPMVYAADRDLRHWLESLDLRERSRLSAEMLSALIETATHFVLAVSESKS